MIGEVVWCGGSGGVDDDPRVASCHACLTNAATYGAAAAMRAAAIEFANNTEAVKERDTIMAEIAAMREALAENDLFHCRRCQTVMHKGFKGRTEAWCKACEAEAS